MDSGTECSLSMFADDTALSGVLNMLEEGDPIQRNLDRLGRRTQAMKLYKSKCKVLHVGQGNPKHKHRLGREWT